VFDAAILTFSNVPEVKKVIYHRLPHLSALFRALFPHPFSYRHVSVRNESLYDQSGTKQEGNCFLVAHKLHV